LKTSQNPISGQKILFQNPNETLFETQKTPISNLLKPFSDPRKHYFRPPKNLNQGGIIFKKSRT
jgi:hypothetical protein